MVIPRKLSGKLKGIETALMGKKKTYPPRGIVFVSIEDQSGSMSHWRQPVGQFWPAVVKHFVESGGEKIAMLIFVLRVIVSGGVVTSEITTLADAKDPAYEPDGNTPLGNAFAATAKKLDDFFRDVVFPNEIAIRNFEVLVVSDLQANGETTEETAAGVAALLGLLKKFNGKVTVVGPDPAAMNVDLARELDVNERGVKYLDADPKSIVRITFDSLLAASRKLGGGSNPTVKNS